MTCTSLSRAAVVLAFVTSAVFAQDATTFKQEELDQLVAPIALYPDSLVTQILMASTYPLEVVEAERWTRQNESLKDDALTAALEKEDWDPSVKSLVNFPQVLSMMSEQLDWTSKLGDAFLAQQKEVLGAIQKLRGKAKTEGNLETTKQQTVVVEEDASTQVIVIESASPEVVYVPTYNPTVVYGAWPYPAYPPYYYYPPGYVAGTAALSFGVGVACGAAWGHAWGNCNWGHGDIDIDVRSFNGGNRINHNRSASNIGNRNDNIQGGNRGKWQHNPEHRKGASYRDQNTANKFGGSTTRDAAKSREAFRGRAEAGRQDIARGGADQFRRGQSPTAGTRDQPNRGGATNRPQTADRQRPANRQEPANRQGVGSPNRGASSDRGRQAQGNRGGAFDGAGRGQSARRESSRGQTSRSSPTRSARGSSPSRSGGSRGGGSRGGMSRGGGGGRGGRGAGYDDDYY